MKRKQPKKENNMTTQETSIAVTPKAAISTQVGRPSFLSGDIPMDKVRVPRLSLLQPGSDEVQLSGKQVGTYENTITTTNYGAELSLIPIKVNFGAIYFKKKGSKDKILGPEDKGLKCKSNDGISNLEGKFCRECPFGVYHQQWIGKTPPACSSTVDIVCLTTDLEPVILTFKNTGYKEGTRLSSALKFNKTLRAFKLTSVFTKNDDGNFFIPKVVGFTDIDDMQYAAAEALRAQVTSGQVEIHEDAGNE